MSAGHDTVVEEGGLGSAAYQPVQGAVLQAEEATCWSYCERTNPY